MPISEPTSAQKTAAFIWHDHEAEDAARFFTSLFDEGRSPDVSRYRGSGREAHGQPATMLKMKKLDIATLEAAARARM